MLTVCITKPVRCNVSICFEAGEPYIDKVEIDGDDLPWALQNDLLRQYAKQQRIESACAQETLDWHESH